MTNKHTELPWKVTDGHYVDSRIAPGRLQEVAYCGDCENGDRNANARLIVKAVNYHERLVEALRAVQEDIAETGEVSDHSCFVIDFVLSDLRKLETQNG